jgi:DNA-binding response OmpR family regulator
MRILLVEDEARMAQAIKGACARRPTRLTWRVTAKAIDATANQQSSSLHVSDSYDAVSGSLLYDESRYQRLVPSFIKSLALILLVSTSEKRLSSIEGW